MRIYVGNAAYGMTDDELRDLFAQYGEVASAMLLKDKYSGRPKGFGFVEMPTDTEAQAAIDALNGKEIGGRALTVNEARPREDRGDAPRRRPAGGEKRGGGGYGGGGGGGGSYNRY